MNAENKKPSNQSQDLKIIAGGAGLIFGAFIASKLFGYIYTIIIARFLGPSDFGIFSEATAVIGIITAIVVLGLPAGILHFYVAHTSQGNKAKARGSVFAGLKIHLASSVIGGVLLFVFADFIAVNIFADPMLGPILRIFAVMLPFSVFTTDLMMIIQASRIIKYKLYVRNFIEIFVKLGLTVLLFFIGYGLMGAIWGLMLSAVAAFLFGLYYVNKHIFKIRDLSTKPVYNYRELFRYSWPLFAVGIFIFLMSTTDLLMLGYFGVASDVGIYNIARVVAVLLTIVPMGFLSMFLPTITAQYARRETSALRTTFKTVTRWSFYLSLPMAAFMLLFPMQIIDVMFGAEYSAAAYPMYFLVTSFFIASFMRANNEILQGIRRTKLIFFNTVFSGVLNIILNAIMIPLYGLPGAAAATMIAVITFNVMAFLEIYILLRIHPYSFDFIKSLFAAAIAAVLFALPVYYLGIPLGLIEVIAIALAFEIVYLFLLLVFRCFREEDVAIVKAAESKYSFIRIPFRGFIRRFI